MTTIVTFINEISGDWAAWLFAASIDSAVLFAVVGLIWLAIRRRATPQVGYWMFFLVALKLLLPISLPVSGRVARWTPSAIVDSWTMTKPGGLRPEDSSPAAFVRTADAEPSVAAFDRGGSSNLSPTQETKLFNESTSIPVGRIAGNQTAINAPPLSFTSSLMIGWLCVVAVLFTWTLWSQWRFRARVKRLVETDAVRLGIDLRDLCRRAGATETVRLVESDELDAPAVWGVIRPTIILPRGIAAALSPSELRWVLLHELTHVRRFDLVAVALERCAVALHFYNPLIWIANGLVDQLREYSCDDSAAALEVDPTAEPAEAFLQILRFVNGRRGLNAALGVFGLGTRAACYRRVRRLLDPERPIRPRLSRRTIGGLLVVALATLPYLRAAGDGESEPSSVAKTTMPSDQQDANGNAASDKTIFDLLIVGPDGKRVPNAEVEIRTDTNPTADDVLVGKFVKHGDYGTFLTADHAGHLRVARARTPSRFNAAIRMPGFGPYWASWSSDTHLEPIPAQFKAELEAGWSVGSVIVDGDGKPIEGARIAPSIEFKKRPGDVRQLGVGTNLKTDAAGNWHFDCVPASMPEVFVEIDHPGCLTLRRSLRRTDFGIRRGGEPSARIELSSGLTVTGKVTDESGNPISGALVRTKFVNSNRDARSGDDGTYRLTGCEPVMARIVVWALGRALEMKEVRVEPGMDAVDFRLQRGGHVRIRMLDEKGDPVARGRVFFQRWRGHIKYFEFDHINQYSNLDGVWEWNEAPLDEFQADICRPGGMQLSQQRLVARDEEYVFRLPSALVVSGNVIDVETKEPIAKFRVVPGIRSSESDMNWVRGDQFSASGGKYSIRQTDDYLAHLVRIEADGYQPAVSRDIKSDEGNITIDFALKRGMNATATVLTPEGRPAADARVALGVAGSQIAVKNGQMNDRSTYSARQDADGAGVFNFPPQDQAFQLVITHPTGFAHVKATADPLPEKISLQAWARVEGIFRIGNKPVGNVPLMIFSNALSSHGDAVPHIFTQQEATTDNDGRFVFDRVLPGPASIGRNLMLNVDDGALEAISACLVRADFPSGKTTHFDLGGNGRQVIGRLRPPPDTTAPVLWNFALVYVQPDGNDETRAEGVRCEATVGRDGRFHLDDLLAGGYILNVRFNRHSAGHLAAYHFQVPAQKEPAQPIDLGELVLKANAE